MEYPHDTMERISRCSIRREFQERFIAWVQHACGKQSREIINVDGKPSRQRQRRTEADTHEAWANKAGIRRWQSMGRRMKLRLCRSCWSCWISKDNNNCRCDELSEGNRTQDQGKRRGLCNRKRTTSPNCGRKQRNTLHPLEEPQFYNRVEKHVTQEKGHGRIETREYYLCTDLDFLKLHGEWRDLRRRDDEIPYNTGGNYYRRNPLLYFLVGRCQGILGCGQKPLGC